MVKRTCTHVAFPRNKEIKSLQNEAILHFHLSFYLIYEIINRLCLEIFVQKMLYFNKLVYKTTKQHKNAIKWSRNISDYYEYSAYIKTRASI